MTFAFPYAFLLFIPWLFAAWRLLRRAKRLHQGIPFAPFALLPARATWRQHVALVAPLLLLAGLAALIVAAARPQKVQISPNRVTRDAIAIAMVLDVSGSMDALDFSEKTLTGWNYKSRLDVVKETFSEFVERRPSDLIGLVTFGGFAVTRSPLTLDHVALAQLLEAVQLPSDPTDQEELLTAIGDGLVMGCARLNEASNVVSKVIVLLSDGDSNAGIVQPSEAAQLAKRQGIKVYTIGVGSTGQAPMRGRDLLGRTVIQNVTVKMDEKALKDIAAMTGGLYYNVRDKKGLEASLAEIDALEKTTVDETVYERRTDFFERWMLWGLALLAGALALSIGLFRKIA